MNLLQLTAKLLLDTTAYEKGISTARSAMNDLGSNMQTVGSAISDVGDIISGLGLAFVGVSTVAAEAFSEIVTSAWEVEDAMAKMSTLFDTSQVSVDGLTKEYIELSHQLGISANELMEAGYQAISAGQSAEESAQFVETAGMLARAGFTQTNTAVDLLTTALNAYSDQNMEAGVAANAFLTIQNLGKTTIGDMNTALGKIIPTASIFNVSIEDIGGAMIQLTRNGVRTRNAGTQLVRMFSELGDTGSGVSEVLQEKTGMSFGQLMAQGYSLSDVLQILINSVDGNAEAYNNLWNSSEAAKGAAAMLKYGLGDLQMYSDAVAQSMAETGSETDLLSVMFDKVSGTSGYTFRSIMNDINLIAIELGRAFNSQTNPILEKFGKIVESVFNYVMNMDDETKSLIVTIVGLVGVAAPVLIVFGKLMSVFGGVVDSVISFGGTLASVPSFFLNYIVTPISQATLSVGGAFTSMISTASGFISGLGSMFSGFSISLSGIWSSIVGVFTGGFDTIASILSGGTLHGAFTSFEYTVFTTLSGVGESIATTIAAFTPFVVAVGLVVAAGVTLYNNWSQVVAKAQELWSVVSQALQNIGNTVMNVINVMVIPIFNAFMKIIQDVYGLWQQIWPTVQSIFMMVFNAIMSALTGLMSLFNTVWPYIDAIVTSVARNIAQVVTSVLIPIWDVFMSVMKTVLSVVQLVWPSIESIIGVVFRAIAGLWNNVLLPVFDIMGFVLSGLFEIFSAIFNGILNVVGICFKGIQLVWNTILSPVFQAVALGVNILFGTIADIFNLILDTAKLVWTKIGNAIKDPMEKAKNFIKEIIDTIKGFFNFEVKWPKIPMPHFGLTPPNWSLGSLISDGVIPKIDISWHSKARYNPMVMDSSTIFGYADGKFLGGGEAGSETLIGTNTLMNMVTAASSRGNGAMVSLLEMIAYSLSDDHLTMIIKQALKDLEFKVGEREFARLVNKYA